MHTTKRSFLKEHQAYGYGSSNTEAERGLIEDDRRIDVLRETEFPHLKGSVYLDHAGATQYAKSQLQKCMEELTSSLLGNPHSVALTHGSSSDGSSSSRIDAMRRRVLAFFNASDEEYAVVFTSGATAAIKLVGECFPWEGGSVFAHTMDSHTSVLGVRGYANQHGARVVSVPVDAIDEMKTAMEPVDLLERRGPPCLFAFPAECNFSGTLHSLQAINHIHQNGFQPSDDPETMSDRPWFVLLDAAKFVATHRLDLGLHKPDFVTISFYKMFGYPSGVGALLVRKPRAMPLLQKVFYGGGTVSNILASSNFVRPRECTDASRLEDGTLPFLSIIALRHGFDLLESLSMKAIEEHTASLVRLLQSELQRLRHWNEEPVCRLYGSNETKPGSIVSLNFLRFDGTFVGYAEVAKLAAIHNIHLRSGCFCNPGACQWYLTLQESDLIAGMEAGHVCGDDVDLVNGQPTGAVRLSVGYMTTFEDIQEFIDFATKYFVAIRAPTAGSDSVMSSSAFQLKKITLFPIKSCAGMSVEAWPVGSRGLLYDREWAILDSSSRKALTLKDAPELCFLEPTIDLPQQTLRIHCRKTGDTLSLPLYASLPDSSMKKDDQDMRVCSAACKGRDVGEDASAWLSQRLGRSCRLVRVATDSLRSASSSSPARDDKIGFANQAQFLLISRASVDHVNASLLAAGADMQVQEDAFRANLVVDSVPRPPLNSGEAFVEDTWTRLRVGEVSFDVTGPCSRCSMINIDPITGAFHRAPLQILSRYRRERANIFFGQFLALRGAAEQRNNASPAPSAVWLRCGTAIDVEVSGKPCLNR